MGLTGEVDAVWTMTEAEFKDELSRAWYQGYDARKEEEDSEYLQYGSAFRESVANPYEEN